MQDNYEINKDFTCRKCHRFLDNNFIMAFAKEDKNGNYVLSCPKCNFEKNEECFQCVNHGELCGDCYYRDTYNNYLKGVNECR